MKKQIFFYLSIAVLFAACKKNSPNSSEPTDSSDISIVIIGASTAAGTGADPMDSAWVNRLRLMTASNPKPLKYTNLALGGYTTYQGMPNGFVKAGRPAPDTARNITKALSLHPNLVMITFPSNDIANGYEAEEVMSNYSRMISSLDSAKVPYILFGTQPRNLSDSVKRAALKQLSTAIQSRYNTSANDYFDQLATNSLTIRPELSFGDGIHLNNKGHYLIVLSVFNHPVFKAVISETAVPARTN